MADPYFGTAYFGNDLNNLVVIEKVRFSFIPGDAHPRIKDAATQTLKADGGQGFVREGIELLFRYHFDDARRIKWAYF